MMGLPLLNPMPPRTFRPLRTVRYAAALLVGVGLLASCSKGSRTAVADSAGSVAGDRYSSSVDEGLGVSVVIVLDNSGSMRDKAKGDKRAKSEMATEALERTLDATEEAIAKRPDYPINVGLVIFSDETNVIMEIQPYNRDSVRAAVARVPKPVGGTAIGDAMQEARALLYRARTFRKIMLVVTDGENTEGADPADVAREIFRRSEGGVGMYFVAFDTDAKKFGFLPEVKGEVVSALNGAALAASLGTLYQGKVLAESDVEPSAPMPLDSSRRAAPATTTPRSNP